ncbi:MAG: O-antigen ligase family protein [Ideonella sp.]|nr:O-antigen ligase family protein [Ideonella sp.]MBL0149848.1 O-antigen ligase family protein [Ideonella sp.]
MTPRLDDRLLRVLGALAIAGAWAVYLPLGIKYAFYLCATAVATLLLLRTHRLHTVLRWPPFLMPLALWLLLLTSTLWTSAPRTDALSHLWHYGRVLLMPLIALALPPSVARRALLHFVLASVVVGALATFDRLQWLHVGDLLLTTVGAEGNQRIVTSLLLALGVALALLYASDALRPPRQRAAWLVAAVVIAVGLSLQDRRTGMVALPLLLAVLALARQRAWRRSALLLGGVVLLAALTWQASPSVRGRFAEGVAELRAYEPQGVVATSWGMRLRMVDLTSEMIRERPWLGHGIGSWLSQWQLRAKGGGELLERQTTPHNEYLLIASQVGAMGIALWIAVLATYLVLAWRAGRQGDASLLVWTAIAWSALFSVAVRDAKFAMPLLLLAALALAASRAAEVDPPER